MKSSFIPNTYAVMGVTGQVGGVVANTLLGNWRSVRAVVRDAAKGRAWQDRGEMALADIGDTASLAAAFRDAEGVFILVPPSFDPSPDFAEARATAGILRAALEAAQPGRVVYLSTIGAQASEPNLLTQHGIIERALGDLHLPITFLRPGWFMENSAWDVTAAHAGVIPSFLQPLGKPVPMVATADIGRVAAELLQEPWTGHRVVELEGPARVSPAEIGETFAKLLGRPVRTEAVARETWEELFRLQGMRNPLPRLRMLDGFNEGWIEFDKGGADSIKGSVSLETVLGALLEKTASH